MILEIILKILNINPSEIIIFYALWMYRLKIGLIWVKSKE